MGLKKIVAIAFCMLLLCSLFMTIGTTMAWAPGAEITEYWAGDIITVDGKWTTPEEWSAGEPHYVGSPQMMVFIFVLDTMTTGVYNMAFVVEFADSTQDAGDIIQMCTNPFTESTVPTAGQDYKFEIQGLTTYKSYEGTGSGWTESSHAASTVQMAASVTTSAHDPAPHVVAEFVWDKGTLYESGPPPQGFAIRCYDASTDTWTTWPEGATDMNPGTWGVLAYYEMGAFPEGLTIGLMLALSSVAAVVSLRYFKKPKL